MNNLTDLITHYGDVIELNFPAWNCDKAKTVLEKHPGWVQYNPRKSINRKGLSVTSLDGGFSGIPDLDSLREYNILNNTKYTELDFKNRTSITNHISELNQLLDAFPDHGRCHFLKLDQGGFFPPHRDNGTSSSLPFTFRIIVPVYNFQQPNLTWVQENNILSLVHGQVYFINTTKVHYLFSMVDMSICFVMNVFGTDRSITTILNNLKVN